MVFFVSLKRIINFAIGKLIDSCPRSRYLFTSLIILVRLIGGATSKILGGPNLRPTVHVLQNMTQ